MTEQQYRVIADRDKGDDILFEGQPGDIEIRDWKTGELLRIERPVPTTDQPTRGHHRVIREFHGNDVWRDDEGTAWVRQEQMFEAVRINLSRHPSVPTHEQIAEVIATTPLPSGGTLLASSVQVEVVADAVLALLDGADR